MSQLFVREAKKYAASHIHTITKVMHSIAVPMIFFSLMIFFGFIHIVVPNLFSLKLTTLLTLLLLGYYFRLDWRLALAAIPVFATFELAAGIISSAGPTKGRLEICFLLLLLGLILQMVGHSYEKKRPAFVDNLSQLYIAPLFMIAECFFYFGFMQKLYISIYGVDEQAINTHNQARYEENTITEGEEDRQTLIDEDASRTPEAPPSKENN